MDTLSMDDIERLEKLVDKVLGEWTNFQRIFKRSTSFMKWLSSLEWWKVLLLCITLFFSSYIGKS